MKKAILLVMVGCICLLSASVVFGAEAERTYEADGHFYVIHFDYNTEYATIPAVNGGKPHYSAKITVYEVIHGKKDELATFGGQYIDGGCFEDDPAYLTKKAHEIARR